MPTRIQLATFKTWNDRLAHVYSTHGLEYTYVVYDKTHPLSENVKELYDNFQSAYNEEHLANATKWVISYGELDVGYRIKQSTADNINASLSSMEAQTHYTRIVNTSAGTTYTQTVYSSNGTTYGRSTYTAGVTNGRTTHTATATNSRTSNPVTTYERTSNRAEQGCSSQSNDGRSGYTSNFSTRVINTNRTSYDEMICEAASVRYTQTTNTAGTSYTNITHTNSVTYSRSTYGASTTYSRTQHGATTTYTES